MTHPSSSIDKARAELHCVIADSAGWSDECDASAIQYVHVMLDAGRTRGEIVKALRECGLSKSGALEVTNEASMDRPQNDVQNSSALAPIDGQNEPEATSASPTTNYAGFGQLLGAAIVIPAGMIYALSPLNPNKGSFLPWQATLVLFAAGVACTFVGSLVGGLIDKACARRGDKHVSTGSSAISREAHEASPADYDTKLLSTTYGQFVASRRAEIGLIWAPVILAWIASGEARIWIRQAVLGRVVFDGFFVVASLTFAVAVIVTRILMFRAARREVSQRYATSYLILASILIIVASISWLNPSGLSLLLSAASIGIPWLAGMDIERHLRARAKRRASKEGEQAEPDVAS